MSLPMPQPMKYSYIKECIESGRLKIPKFQRNFVWTKEDSAKLVDSIIKEYPLGSFIFWSTNAKLNSIKNIGELELPNMKETEWVEYVLDGQQRITTLYAIFEGIKIKKNNSIENFEEVYIDLTVDNKFEPIVITDIKGKDENTIIKLKTLLNGSIKDFNKYDEKYHDKIELYKNNINGYTFSVIKTECNIAEATEIFARLNTGGKKLTVFEIMVAITYDDIIPFDLAKKYDELIEKLQIINYETISSSVFLHVIAMLVDKKCDKNSILSLNKEKVINICDNAIECIIATCNYFKNTYRILASRMLPYDNLIVPFSYYFYKTGKNKRPIENVEKELKNYFWRAVLTNRFGSSVESKLEEDINKINNIIEEKNIEYEQVNITKAFLKNNSWFNVGNAFIKGILCVYAFEQPKSFFDNTIVEIINDGLKQSNSRDYHHFFPRAYLNRKGIPEKDINSIFNITLLDKYINREKIKDKAPMIYIEEAKKTNMNLKNTLDTHLIDIDNSGIYEDDYSKFIEKRLENVIKKLNSLLILKQNDYYDKEEVEETNNDK